MKMKIAHKMINHLTMVTQAQAWDTWHSVITHEYNETTARKHLLGRILRLKQSAAWDAWKTDVQNKQEVDSMTTIEMR
jgi:hypothetical protein